LEVVVVVWSYTIRRGIKWRNNNLLEEKTHGRVMQKHYFALPVAPLSRATPKRGTQFFLAPLVTTINSRLTIEDSPEISNFTILHHHE
jgi:hypothetical protein